MNRNVTVATIVVALLYVLGAAAHILFGIEYAIWATFPIGVGLLVWLGRKWRYEILSKIGAQSEHLRAISVLTATLKGQPIFWTPHALSPESLYLILHLLDGLSARRVLELGSGTSTILVANFFSLRGYGTIQSFDHGQRWAKSTAAKLEEMGLCDHATIAEVGLRDINCQGQSIAWYDIPESLSREPFDFVIVDGPPSWQGDGLARLPALYELNKMMTESAVLVLDDADRAWESEIARRWQEDFPGFIFRKVAIGRGLLVVSKSQAVFDLLP